MPGLVPGIHVLGLVADEDVDGRDNPGHDEGNIWHTPLANSPLAIFARLRPYRGMLTTPDSFRQHYQALVSSGTIERDPAQIKTADAFAALEQRLSGYKPARKQRLLGRLFRDKDEEPPRG